MEVAIVVTSLGLAANAILGLVGGVRVLEKRAKVPWRISLWLLVSMAVFVPAYMADVAMQKIIDELETMLNYPKYVSSVFKEWNPHVNLLPTPDANGVLERGCNYEREEAIKAADRYIVPDIGNFQAALDDNRGFLYAQAGSFLVFAVVHVWLSYMRSIHDIFRFAGRTLAVWNSVTFSMVGGMFVGVAALLMHICDEYLNGSKLHDEIAWLVDSNFQGSGDGIRPWVPSREDFIVICNPPEVVKETLYPGILLEEFETAKEAVCGDLVQSLLAAGAILIGAVLAWEAVIVDNVYTSSALPGKVKNRKINF